MATRSKPKPRRMKIYTDEKDLGKYFTVDVVRAKKVVTIHREVRHVMEGKAGATIGCTNSNCAVDVENKKNFGHPVYLAVFTKTSAYMVDKLGPGKQPKRVVWYHHNDAEGVDVNDVLKPEERVEFLKDKVNKIITLRPPKARDDVGKVSGSKPGTWRGPTVARGAARRAEMAGIAIPITQE